MNRANLSARFDLIRKEQLSTALLTLAKVEAERQELAAEHEAMVGIIRDLEKRLRKYEPRKRQAKPIGLDPATEALGKRVADELKR